MRFRNQLLFAAVVLAGTGAGTWFWFAEQGLLPAIKKSPAPQSPVIPIGPARVAPQIARGYGSLLVVAPDGSLWGWGASPLGELGARATNLFQQPRRIGEGADWRAVAPGSGFVIGLKTNGTLWAWGSDRFLVGDRPVEASAPAPVNRQSNWVAIASGSAHVVALKADGTVWTWGHNNVLQLGDGSDRDQAKPTRLGRSTNWLSITAGSFHSAGLQRDGSVWVWGHDPLAPGGLPTRLGKGARWKAVHAAEFHTVARQEDGAWWVWGLNAASLLGSPTPRDQMVQIENAPAWVAVAGGTTHNLALQSDGSLWAWGSNSSGELGAPSAKPPGRPGSVLRVGVASDWVAVGAAANMSAGLTADGGLWVWGVRLDQPPTVRIHWFARLFRLLGPLLSWTGFSPGPDQEVVYARSPTPQRILTFQSQAASGAR